MIQRSTMIPCALALIFSFVGSTLAYCLQEKQTPRPIKRAKRPIFKPRDWDGVYFENLFRDGLSGPRPATLAPGEMPRPNVVSNGTSPPSENGSNSESGGFAWSKLISASSIEDEVKSIQKQLTIDITTPTKFKSDYAKSHQSFSILSMLFAVIREYDADVRWKEFGGDAQASFEKAAANSRVGTIQAYESCKRRSEDLKELVGGGKFNGTDKASESLDWSLIVGHSPVMLRLEKSYEKLKQMTSSKNDFSKNISDVLRESELVAVMSYSIQQEGMEYAEEDSYVEFAKIMQAAASKGAAACRTNDYDSISAAVNTIGQSCSNCHDEWR